MRRDILDKAFAERSLRAQAKEFIGLANASGDPSVEGILVEVVKAALVGSILSNLLLVLGLAFLVGGLKHGVQKLGSDRARTVIILMLLSVMGLTIPSLAHWIHSPAEPHEETFSLIVSVVLLGLFLLYLPASLKRGRIGITSEKDITSEPRWPLWLAVGLLAVASILAAFVTSPAIPTDASFCTSIVRAPSA